MQNLTTRLIDCAAKSFPMDGPVFEFGFSPLQPTRPPREQSDGNDSKQIDRLEDLCHLPFSDGEAGTILCENALQYAFEPHAAISEMIRVLRPGGLILVTTSTCEQSGANHYWTPSPGAVTRMLAPLAGSLIGWIGPEASPHTIFALGCKEPLPGGFARGVQPFFEQIERTLKQAAAQVGLTASLKRRLVAWMCSPEQQRTWRDYYQAQYILHLPIDGKSPSSLLASCLPAAQPGSRLDLSE